MEEGEEGEGTKYVPFFSPSFFPLSSSLSECKRKVFTCIDERVFQDEWHQMVASAVSLKGSKSLRYYGWNEVLKYQLDVLLTLT